MQKILIFTASYGGGHNSVARALAEHLKSHYKNVSVDVVDFMARFAAGDRLMRILYKQSAKRLPAAYALFFKLTDKLFEKPLWKKVLVPALNQVRQFLLAAQPDIVVSVYPTAGIVASRLGKERGFRTATVITDFGAHSQWIDKNTDLYFVPTDNLKNFLIAKGIKSNRIKVTGIPIRDIFSSTPAISTIRRKFGLINRFTVLIMSGEYGLGKIKRICLQLTKSPLQLIVVCGRNKRLYRKITELKRRKRAKNLICLGFTEEVPALMKVSDILLGKAGGITVSEAMASRLPIVIYRPIPGQEFYNVDYLVNQGAALYARNTDDAMAKIRFLYEHPDRLKEMKRKASRIGKPNATRDICVTLCRY